MGKAPKCVEVGKSSPPHDAQCDLPPRKKAVAAVTLGQHLDTVFAAYGPQKKTTAANYDRARRLLEEFFGKERIMISVTPGDADDYKAWLLRKSSRTSA